MFDRVLCGVDGTPETMNAVRQARRIATPTAELLLVGVLDTGQAVHAGWAATQILEDLRSEELRALAAARTAAGPRAEARLLQGVPWSSLSEAARDEAVDLVAIGTHERSRAAGIVIGSVATYLLHESPCSVLIARPAELPEEFPRSIVVGFDGSQDAVAALAAAGELAEGHGAELTVLAAAGEQKLALEPIRALAPTAVVDHRPPVEALVAESERADLLVLGSRGLHGLAALGSVSERVAHRARCSVLVMRSEAPDRR